jgi:YidC/Oxa1 family membrane protein insertase
MDQRNLILAIVLSVTILLTFQIFFAPPTPDPGTQATTATDGTLPGGGDAEVPQLPGGSAVSTAGDGISREKALEESPRVTITSPKLSGSLSLQGGRIDDLILKSYHETIEPDSPLITLLSPPDAPNPYYADFGWTATDRSVMVPGPDTLWETDGNTLSPGNPITLTWDNGEGLVFERLLELDPEYLFTVTQRVVNNSGQPVILSPYGLISRTGTPPVLGFYILHEGLIGVFDGTLKEVDYDDLQDIGVQAQDTTGGWIGITDKYWLTALVPDQESPVKTRFVHRLKDGIDKYQTDYLYEPITIAAGGTGSTTGRLFAGAKKVLLLNEYEELYNIKRFDLAVDFGWFYFLTKPLFYLLHWLGEVTGNFGIAILIATVMIKTCFFPLANKSYVSMAKMRKLQPKMVELRERFGDDKQRLNQEMMGLYKKESVNPLSGCLPIVIQIPVFFALYKVLFVSIEMRQAPFYGWIHDLSAPDPTSILNGFGLLPWVVPNLGALDIINIGVWPLLMGITMFLQQRLNPQPPDPIQAKIFLFMPIMFTFLLARFPAGLVIYWTWNNLLSITQQAVIMKRAGVPLGRPKKT